MKYQELSRIVDPLYLVNEYTVFTRLVSSLCPTAYCLLYNFFVKSNSVFQTAKSGAMALKIWPLNSNRWSSHLVLLSCFSCSWPLQ